MMRAIQLTLRDSKLNDFPNGKGCSFSGLLLKIIKGSKCFLIYRSDRT